jgi:hypothetical protein
MARRVRGKAIRAPDRAEKAAMTAQGITAAGMGGQVTMVTVVTPAAAPDQTAAATQAAPAPMAGQPMAANPQAMAAEATAPAGMAAMAAEAHLLRVLARLAPGPTVATAATRGLAPPARDPARTWTPPARGPQVPVPQARALRVPARRVRVLPARAHPARAPRVPITSARALARRAQGPAPAHPARAAAPAHPALAHRARVQAPRARGPDRAPATTRCLFPERYLALSQSGPTPASTSSGGSSL